MSLQTPAHTYSFIYVYPRTSLGKLWECFTNLAQLMQLDDCIENHTKQLLDVKLGKGTVNHDILS